MWEWNPCCGFHHCERGGMGSCLLGRTKFHLQLTCYPLTCCSGGGGSPGSLLMDYSLVTIHLCPLFSLWQHQKHLFGEESLCCSGWKEPHCQEHQTSLPKPPSAKIVKRMAKSSCCTSFSINSMAICCQFLPAFISYANQSCRRPSTLGFSWMEVAAEMQFSVFTLWWWKGLVWQEQGLKLLFAFFLGLVECPAQKFTLSFFTISTVINYRWRRQGYPPGVTLGWKRTWEALGTAVPELNALCFTHCASSSHPGQQGPVVQCFTFFSCGKSEPPGIWYCAFFVFSPRYFCLWTTENWIGGNEVQIENMVECTC